VNINKLKSGPYRLTKRVDNPRSSFYDEWKAAKSFEPGLYLIWTDETVKLNDTCQLIVNIYKVCHPNQSRDLEPGRLQGIFYRKPSKKKYKRKKDLFDSAVVWSLVHKMKLDKSLESELIFAEQNDCLRSRDVLLQLVKSGIVSENEVRAAMCKKP